MCIVIYYIVVVERSAEVLCVIMCVGSVIGDVFSVIKFSPIFMEAKLPPQPSFTSFHAFLHN